MGFLSQFHALFIGAAHFLTSSCNFDQTYIFLFAKAILGGRGALDGDMMVGKCFGFILFYRPDLAKSISGRLMPHAFVTLEIAILQAVYGGCVCLYCCILMDFVKSGQ